MEERRSDYPMCEKKIYALNNIDNHIESERRMDELDRLREAREQKRVWLKTVILCGSLNLVLLAFAFIGALTK